jgi:hypothetical protein
MSPFLSANGSYVPLVNCALILSCLILPLTRRISEGGHPGSHPPILCMVIIPHPPEFNMSPLKEMRLCGMSSSPSTPMVTFLTSWFAR